ncbi:serine/threonine-protein kinase [Moraxella osloensis]|jgi:serine/threonine protein kinase|uniref:serine/threonine-protein kinase n=1 Tax=Moraxella sp. CTOTU49803 TaxID=2953840 RepID=UPI0024C24559|nr:MULTISPECIES: serine/threonine-protein kinase [Moraxella]MDK1669475.1 serine/threonine-protein kinase [Moraxella osloensis]
MIETRSIHKVLVIIKNGCQSVVTDLQPLSPSNPLNHTELWYGVWYSTHSPPTAVVVKQLLPHFSATNLAHFEQEINALHHCQSLAIDSTHATSGIPTLYASNVLPDTLIFDQQQPQQSVSPCLVMSYHSGETLKSLMYAHAKLPILSLQQKMTIFLHSCQVVNRLHQCGLMHLDLKPANFIVKPNLEVVLIDFGLSDFGVSDAMGKNASLNCKTYTAGTPAYMSPEQFTGQPVDKFSDYYSLGVIWYELLMGYLPFMADDYPNWAIAHCQQPVPFLCPNHQLSEFACQACQPFIDKLLAKRVENRINDLSNIINALKILLNQ